MVREVLNNGEFAIDFVNSPFRKGRTLGVSARDAIPEVSKVREDIYAVHETVHCSHFVFPWREEARFAPTINDERLGVLDERKLQVQRFVHYVLG